VQKPNESWAEATRLSSTNRASTLTTSSSCASSRTVLSPALYGQTPHIAYRVDDLEAALEGQEVVLGPITTPGFSTRAFVAAPDGLAAFMPLVELIQYDDPNEEGWA
jgi:hypothetical protein